MCSALPANSATLHSLCPNSPMMTDCCSRRVNWSGLEHEATSWGPTKEWQWDQLQKKPWESKVESTPIAPSGRLPLPVEERTAISSHKRNRNGNFFVSVYIGYEPKTRKASSSSGSVSSTHQGATLEKPPANEEETANYRKGLEPPTSTTSRQSWQPFSILWSGFLTNPAPPSLVRV